MTPSSGLIVVLVSIGGPCWKVCPMELEMAEIGGNLA
jgi:hypothetical protein